MTKRTAQTAKDAKRAATAADLIDIMEEVRYLAVNTQNACDASGVGNPYRDKVSPEAIAAAKAAVRYARQAQHFASEIHGYDRL